MAGFNGRHPCLSESLWLETNQNCTGPEEAASDLFPDCLHKLEDRAAVKGCYLPPLSPVKQGEAP